MQPHSCARRLSRRWFPRSVAALGLRPPSQRPVVPAKTRDPWSAHQLPAFSGMASSVKPVDGEALASVIFPRAAPLDLRVKILADEHFQIKLLQRKKLHMLRLILTWHQHILDMCNRGD